MKTKISLIIAIILSVISIQAMANDTRERMYLIQMTNQLDALKPLIIAADKEQDKNSRIKFHYKSYRESNGVIHNGLLEDINEIKKGIFEKLNQTIGEPRNFQAIKGDYRDLNKVKSEPVGNTEEIHDVK
jgi:RAQPRD family integrative conjugative element protein